MGRSLFGEDFTPSCLALDKAVLEACPLCADAPTHGPSHHPETAPLPCLHFLAAAAMCKQKAQSQGQDVPGLEALALGTSCCQQSAGREGGRERCSPHPQLPAGKNSSVGSPALRPRVPVHLVYLYPERPRNALPFWLSPGLGGGNLTSLPCLQLTSGTPRASRGL